MSPHTFLKESASETLESREVYTVRELSREERTIPTVCKTSHEPIVLKDIKRALLKARILSPSFKGP